MVNKYYFLLVIILFTSFIIVSSFDFVSSEVIIVNPNETDPFNYSTNATIPPPINKTADYLSNVTDETLRKLIEALVNSSRLNDEVKGYLESMINAYGKNQKDFNDALEKLNYAYETMKDNRDEAVANFKELEKDTTVRFETLETEVESVRLENTKLKAWVFFYIIFGITIGVLILQIAIYLKKNQKFYFVVRAIRDKIPIKF